MMPKNQAPVLGPVSAAEDQHDTALSVVRPIRRFS